MKANGICALCNRHRATIGIAIGARYCVDMRECAATRKGVALPPAPEPAPNGRNVYA